MKNYLLLIFLSLLCRFTLCAQQHSISGIVRNKKNEALPQSSVSLVIVSGKKYYSLNTVSDSLGNYRFEKLSFGKYILTASHVGYVLAVSDTITINATPVTYTYHFVLVDEVASFKEVTVTSKKRPIEMDKGKIVFNVQNLATTSGLSAFDLLKKMPGVTVDQNENIILRGSTGINVLIDGKMTYLSDTQLTNYLKGMSAEDINKIELNQTPSAEFDAAGNAGIINIIPKKSSQKGYAVDVRSSITKGIYWMPDENISASFRAKKFNLYGSLGYKTVRSQWNNVSGNAINDTGISTQLKRNNQEETNAPYYTWHAGGEWQFLPKHKLGFDYLGYLDDWKSNNISTANNYDENGNLLSYIHSVNNLYEPYHYDGATLDYRFDIDTTGKKITTEAHYISYRNYSDGALTTSQYDAAGNFTGSNVLLSHQPGFRKIKSVKTDAELPFKNIYVRTGFKYAEVTNENPFSYDSLHAGNYVAIDDMSDHYKYKEQIAAIYFSASKKINKTNIDAGLRWEYTKAESYTIKQDVDNHWEYNNLFPSFSVGHDIDENNKINFSASRRINRPSYNNLNLVRWYTDQYFYYTGNPALVPELAWIFSTAYTLNRKYVFTATYGLTNNYMNRKLSIDTNGYTIKSQPANLGQLHRLDVMASLPLQIFPLWDMELVPVISYMAYPISQLTGETKLAGWSVTLSAQQHLTFPAGIKMDISTEYYSKAFRGIYITKAGFYTDLGVKKSFFKKKMDVQISVSDVFNTLRYQGVSQSNISNYYYNDKPDSRRLGITLHYHFGSELFKRNNKKTEEQERL